MFRDEQMRAAYRSGVHAVAFRALGEPSRLRIVESLRAGPSAVGDPSSRLEIRRPQVSKHLLVLHDAGLVTGGALARHRIYRLRREPFVDRAEWVGSFEQLWETRLDALSDDLSSIAYEGADDDRDR